MLTLALLLLSAAQPEEDAAHRADRLATEALNRRAAGRIREPAPSPRDMAAWRAAQQDYARARADHAREIARWRRQVADCRGGDEDACRPR